MLLVIFGAGASFDSAPFMPPGKGPDDATAWRPPLANELFANRQGFRDAMSRFPQILPIAARLAQAGPQQPLERMLAALRDEAEYYHERHSQLVAVRYYLQFVIWECERHWLQAQTAVTNYLSLLDRIQRWRGGNTSVVFGTFNYDRLFEYAASYYISGAKTIYENAYGTLEAYTQHPHFPLIKLHGSLDWGYRVNTPLAVVSESNGHVWQIAWDVTTRFPDLDVAHEVEKITERPPQPQGGHAYVPALALPVDQKSEFVCPRAHLDFLVQHLPQVTSVLTIGWRGTESHFLQTLKNHLATEVDLLTVCGEVSSGQQMLETLSAAGLNGSWHASNAGFSEFVVGPEVDSFLERALK